MRNKLFDISRKPLLFRCEEDRIFFENQRSSREFTIGKVDKEDNRKIRNSEIRKQRDKRKSDSNESQAKRKCIEPIETEDEDLIEDPFYGDPDWLPDPLSKRRQYQLGDDYVDIKLNKRDWLNTVAALADKTIASSRTACSSFNCRVK